MKLLLHVCCAGCVISPFEDLVNREFDSIMGFFYNPNIHPVAEFALRRDALRGYSKRKNLDVAYHKYDIENYFRHTSGNEEAPDRCNICWRLRLEETAKYAKEHGFESFSTTLLISPYQDHDKVKGIAGEVARLHGVKFFYKDLRPLFKDSQARMKEEGLYRQKYCGCIFSERERLKKKEKL